MFELARACSVSLILFYAKMIQMCVCVYVRAFSHDFLHTKVCVYVYVCVCVCCCDDARSQIFRDFLLQ